MNESTVLPREHALALPVFLNNASEPALKQGGLFIIAVQHLFSLAEPRLYL